MAGKATFGYYLDKQIKWRWRLRAPNGKIIAASGENFEEYTDMMDSIKKVIAYCGDSPKITRVES
jgi:uncharacterized protein